MSKKTTPPDDTTPVRWHGACEDALITLLEAAVERRAELKPLELARMIEVAAKSLTESAALLGKAPPK